MRISILTYDISAIDRIKANTYKFFFKNDEVKEIGDIIWIKDISIEFQNRLIVLNLPLEWSGVDIQIEKYLDTVLKNEEVTINDGKKLEYNMQYGKSPKLLVAYT